MVTLVAYMGDGIMAVFGAPLVQDDHADRALAAALEMRDLRLPPFNAWIREQGLGEGLRMGSLNSGHLMSESTKEGLRSPHAELVFFDELPIRGRVEPVELWSVAEGVAAVTPQPVPASSSEGEE